MGTTTKIIFGSALALSLVLLFLIFSMQKSAQLTLDMENITHSVQEKDQKMAAIQQQLQTAVESDKAKGALIPELKSNIAAAEKEKLAYVQQLDELQEQLANADTKLAEFSRMQEEYEQHQLLFAETEKAKTSADLHAAQTAEELKGVQETLIQREARINQFGATLEQKELLLKSFKEQLEQTAEETTLLKAKLSDNRLNLNLVLDELTAKNKIIAELILKIEQLGAPIQLQGEIPSKINGEKVALDNELQLLIKKLAHDKTPVTKNEITALSAALAKKDYELRIVHEELQQLKVKEQALFPAAIAEARELQLINNSLHATIREQDSLIEGLRDDIQASEALLAGGTAEIEQLQANGQDLAEEINRLLLVEQNNEQELAELKTSLADNEQELKAAKEQASGVSTTLEEKITALEQQLIETTNKNTELTDELNKAETTLVAVREEKNSLGTELAPAKSALEEAQKEISQLSEALKSAEAALDQEQTASQSLSTEIEPVKLALSQEQEKYSALENQYEELKNQLTALNEEGQQQAEQVKSLQEQLSQQAGSQEEAQSDLSEKLSAAESSLHAAQEKASSLETEIAEKEAALQSLTAQLSENNAQIAELQTSLEQASAQKSAQASSATEEQELRISRLIEEVAAAKAISAEQTVILQSTEEQITLLTKEKQELTTELQGALQAGSELAEQNNALQASAAEASKKLAEQLAALEEKAGSTSNLEMKNQDLEAALSDSQNKLAADQEKIIALEATLAALQAERNQLFLHTIDSDNDGVSDAKDTCGDTVQGAEVDAEGCEKDNDQDGLVNRLDLCPDTASGREIDSAGCSAEQTIVVLEGIKFQLGTAKLTENDHAVLKTVAIILQNNPDLNMEVAGHTDSIGDAKSNQRLSTIRAQAVLNYLVTQGVAADRLQAKGYGSENPIADNKTNAGRAQNRRVELRRIDATTPQAEEESAPVEESTDISDVEAAATTDDETDLEPATEAVSEDGPPQTD